MLAGTRYIFCSLEDFFSIFRLGSQRKELLLAMADDKDGVNNKKAPISRRALPASFLSGQFIPCFGTVADNEHLLCVSWVNFENAVYVGKFEAVAQ